MAAFEAAFRGSQHVVTQSERAIILHQDRRMRNSDSNESDDDYRSGELMSDGTDNFFAAQSFPSLSSDESPPSTPQVQAVINYAAHSEQPNCPLCWEEQPYLDANDVDDTNASTRHSAMVDKVNDFRDIIFRFERLLRGHQNDETIFLGMLELRRLNVERYFDEHSPSSFRMTRWTMQMLRDHYSPAKAHRFDLVRELDVELLDMRWMRSCVMKHAMFVEHPESGDRIFNMRAVDTRLRLSKHIIDMVTRKSTELRRRTSAVDVRVVLQAVNQSVNRLTQQAAVNGGGGGGDLHNSVSAVAEMYEIGGL